MIFQIVIKPGTPVLQADSLTSEPPGKPTEYSLVHLCVHSTNVYCVVCVPPNLEGFVLFLFLFWWVKESPIRYWRREATVHCQPGTPKSG